MENLSNPFVVGFYVLSMVVDRVASVARHLERAAIARRGSRPGPLDATSFSPAGKVFAAAIAGAFIVIAVWVYLDGTGPVVA